MKESKQTNNIARREFIRNVSLAGVGLALTPTLLNFHVGNAKAAANVGKVVVATNEDLTVGGASIDADTAKLLLDAAMKKITGVGSVEAAWRSIFPSLTKNDIIGIKVNTINGALSSHPQVVNAIADSLIGIGVPENNIWIWDRWKHELTRAIFVINEGDAGVKCFSTNAAGWGYDKAKGFKMGGQTRYLSKILTQGCDYLINVPVLKDHNIAGVTLSMKNHYGSVDAPNAMHGSNCDPYIANLNNAVPIKEKTTLIVMDAALGIYHGGPGGSPQFIYNSLIVSQDPVAIDYHGSQIIDEERVKRGLQPVANIGRPAKYIDSAAKLGLGTNDPKEIQVMTTSISQHIDTKDKRQTTWGAVKNLN